jgi:hypothetical protein
VSAEQVEEIESAPVLRRGLLVWYPVAGPVLLWTAHLVFLASAEHWAHDEHQWAWTLNAATVVTALGTVVALVMCWRLLKVAEEGDEGSADDTGQLKFLAQLGLLVGAINLALILLEGSYVWFFPHT